MGGDTRQSNTLTSSAPPLDHDLTFEEPVDDLEAGAEVRQGELVELGPALWRHTG